MYKRFILLLACLIFAGLSTKGAEAANWQGNFNVLLGGRTMQDSDFGTSNLDKLGVFGLEVDFKQKSGPINMFLGLSSAATSDTIVGLDLRVLTGANYSSVTKADYSQVGLMLGYRF